MNHSPDAIPLKPRSESLSLRTKLAYGVGELGGEIPNNILVFFLLFFLTSVAGLNPTLAGSVLLISKVWDAVNDPLIGILSDRTRSPLGRRYPWMLAGAIPLGVCFCLQWFVPPTTNQWLLFAYYSGIALLFYTAFTAVAVPHSTLAAELTTGYDERTSLVSFKAAFSIGASILSLTLAQVIFAKIADPSKKYLILGGVCGIIAMSAVCVCVWGTYKRYQAIQAQRIPVSLSSSLPIRQQLQIALSNFPFLCVIGIYLCSWLGLQVTAAILPYFVINWMRLPDHYFTQTAIAVQGTALTMMFFWSAVATRLGKRAIYGMGIPLTICALVGLCFLQPGQVGLMYVLAVMTGVGLSTAYLVPWSMLPDVLDLDELNTGQRREGIFCGLVVQFQKTALAIALFLVGKILDWAGFIPTTPGQSLPSQPESALLAIRWLIGPVPALVLVFGLVCAYFYPITRSVHGEILLKLLERRNSSKHL
ncbi:MFS transporter [Microcoleus sp. FACHB-SPT15]|uniref:MFS transporter n=1 Tax=Microcoleus sp. FACHB-SPT15 TaxID=2692830 RepID=UPI00177C97A5|nr:MFS transporter [Microcoleus sp. FACHB-SPT15]MBD1805969.1 MFS transporter [Microcoleus sp. FACHB-SPT15]